MNLGWRSARLTCVVVYIEVGWYFDNVPGPGLPVVGQIDVVLVVEEGQGHLVPGEGPRAELHDAGLLVEREVGHVNRTRGLKYNGLKGTDRKKTNIYFMLN